MGCRGFGVTIDPRRVFLAPPPVCGSRRTYCCTTVVVTATSPFSAHVRGHTIGVTIDRGVFFCLLLVCVL